MTQKHDLTDTTILVPIRVDSIVRLENLMASIESLRRSFKTHISVLEACNYKNGFLERLLPRNVMYTFVEDTDPIFHRTHYINQLARGIQTPYICIWDADVIIPPAQIRQAAALLREGTDVVFPYDGTFLDTTATLRDIYMHRPSIAFLRRQRKKMLLPYGTNMGGGAIFVRRDSFLRTGGEDERFYGWGPEDWNRLEKWHTLGMDIRRVDGPLFHLTHPRDINGGHSHSLQKDLSFLILRTTQKASTEDIKKKLQTNFI